MNNEEMSTAIILNGHGDPEVLTSSQINIPIPRPDEIRIRVAAAGVNGPDILQRKGLYAPTPENVLRPGLEVSGCVDAVGDRVLDWSMGDKIVALCNGGGYADYVCAPQGQALPLPKNWSFLEGASLPETFFTIQQTLLDRSGLTSGMSVLVHGASGGIGATAIQLAKVKGATVFAAVSSMIKAKYVLSLGADHLITYPEEDFVEHVLELTGGRGVDRIVDVVGADYLSRNIRAAAQGAVIVQLAFLGGAKAHINLAPMMLKNLTLIGSVLGPQPACVKQNIATNLRREIWSALNDGRVKPQYIRAFALSDAARAHRAFQSANHYGKIVLVTAFGETFAA